MFEVINLSWHKRRSRTDLERKGVDVKDIRIEDFKFERNSMCTVFCNINGTDCILIGQVLFNSIKETWSINAIDGSGNQLALKIVK